MARKLALALALLGALAISGCAVVKQEQAVQQGGIGGSMLISATVCFTGFGDGSGDDCASGPVDAGEFQALVAVHVPDDVAGPPVLEAALDGGETVTLAHSNSYTDELQQSAPAIDGMRWLGYISPPRVFAPDPGSGSAPTGPRATIAGQVSLGSTSGGPRQGVFRYQVVAGQRPGFATGSPAADRDVECADDVTQAAADGTRCVDATEADTLTTIHETELADVTLTAPAAPVTVQAGKTATVPFTVAFYGSPPPLEVSGTTDVSGATFTPAIATVTQPGALPIAVVVPADTPPGDYGVWASVSTDLVVRSAVATVRVVAPPSPPPPPAAGDTTAPGITIKAVKGQTPRRVARKGLKLRLTLTEAATVAGGLARGKPVEKALPEGTSTLRLKLTRKSRKAVKRARKVKLALALTATDAAGNVGTLDRKVKIRRPRR